MLQSHSFHPNRISTNGLPRLAFRQVGLQNKI
uniref:Uncharacterized protein n=1 Tax=Anguilla anguilla TaxID=7936 RepID=A0A0E9TY37_ANGAN